MHEALPYRPLEGAPEDQALLVAPEVREAEAAEASTPLIHLNEEHGDETPLAIAVAPETADGAEPAPDVTADVPEAAEPAEEPAAKPKRQRGKKAEVVEAEVPAEPAAEVVEPLDTAPEASQDAPEAVEDEDTVEMPIEGEVATGGLARAWRGYWAERRDRQRRADLARQHAAAEHALALEAADLLPPDATPEQHREKVDELRQQKVAAEAAAKEAKAQETQKTRDLAEAASLEAEAAALENDVKTMIAPAHEQLQAQYEQVIEIAERIRENVEAAGAARGTYLSRAAELRQQADNLRARYDESRIPLERVGEPMAA